MVNEIVKTKEKKYILLFMSGHIITDINQGALPALLPFLVLQHGLSFSAAGGLILALTGISSVIQPLLGHLSDRIGNPQLMSFGILIAGVGFAALGMVSSYPLMFLCVLVSGVGIALFHPEGGRMVNCVARTGKGTAMGTFSLGGSVGFTIGPLLVAAIVPLLGLRGLLLFLIPPVIMFFILQYHRKVLKDYSDKEFLQRKSQETERRKDNWKGFFILSAIILIDSIVTYGLMTFIPLFWVNVLGQKEKISSLMLAVMTGLGAVSTYIGGKSADRFGFRRVIIVGSLLYGPAILFAALSANIPLAVAGIVILGLTTKLIQSPAVALGQQYLPNHVGLASGITLGLAVSFGGIASPALGWIGDTSGLTAVMLTLAGIGAFASLFSLLIPRNKQDKSE